MTSKTFTRLQAISGLEWRWRWKLAGELELEWMWKWKWKWTRKWKWTWEPGITPESTPSPNFLAMGSPDVYTKTKVLDVCAKYQLVDEKKRQSARSCLLRIVPILVKLGAT